MKTTIFPAMGTVCSITVPTDTRSEVLKAVRRRILLLHNNCTMFDEDSQVSSLSRQAGKGMVDLSDDTYRLLKYSKDFARQTGGVFDITMAPLTRLWKTALAQNQLPSDKEIAKAKKLVGWRDLLLSKDPLIGKNPLTDKESLIGKDQFHPQAALKKAGEGVDLGGIAKGYALDLASQMLKEEGVPKALLDFGGSITALGTPFTVGIQNPLCPTGQAMGSINLKPGYSCVTSGIYEQDSSIRGRQVHHIIDPRTSRPSQSGLISVTLIGTDAMRLDALATAVLILGVKEGLSLVRTEHIDAIFVTDDDQVWATFPFQLQPARDPSLPNHFSLTRNGEPL